MDFENSFDAPLMNFLKVNGSAMEKSWDNVELDGQHSVVVNKLKSDWAPVSSGVP